MVVDIHLVFGTVIIVIFDDGESVIFGPRSRIMGISFIIQYMNSIRKYTL